MTSKHKTASKMKTTSKNENYRKHKARQAKRLMKAHLEDQTWPELTQPILCLLSLNTIHHFIKV